jgi:plastocyanin
MRRTISFIISTTAILAFVTLGNLGWTPAHQDTVRQSAAHVVKIITLKNGTYAFSPKTITVKVGSTVWWKNNTGAFHTVTTGNPKFGISNISAPAAAARNRKEFE